MSVPSDWRADYHANLDAAQPSNANANLDAKLLLETCTKLSNTIIELRSEIEALRSSDTHPPSTAPETTEAALAQLRIDVAEAVRSRDNAHQRLRTADGEVDRLRARTAADARRVREQAERETVLARKLRDRESELVEKGKLVSEVQNDMFAMTIELTQREGEIKKLKEEVAGLTSRLLAFKEREVDALNLANERARA